MNVWKPRPRPKSPDPAPGVKPVFLNPVCGVLENGSCGWTYPDPKLGPGLEPCVGPEKGGGGVKEELKVGLTQDRSDDDPYPKPKEGVRLCPWPCPEPLIAL